MRLGYPALAQDSIMDLNLQHRLLGRIVRLPSVFEALDEAGQVVNIDLPGATDFHADLFHAYFSDSDLMPSDDIPVYRQVNAALIDWLKKTPEWPVSQSATQGSIFTSAVASQAVAAELMSDPKILELLKKQQELQEQMQSSAGGDKDSGQKQKQLSDAVEKAFGGQDIYQEAQMRRAVQKGVEKAQEQEAQLISWGLDPGEVTESDLAAILKMLKDNPKLNQIADLMGRAKGIALTSRVGKRTTGVVLHNSGFTKNLLHAFPSEQALLQKSTNPAIRAQKIAQWLSYGLLGMLPRDEQTRTGYMVAAIDASGSMDGERDVRAKAISLGMARAGLENGQSYTMFTFQAGARMPQIDSTQSWKQHMLWAGQGCGGGTSFDDAITNSLRIVESLPKETALTADIIVVTDGESNVSDSTKKKLKQAKKELGLRLIFLMVGDHISLHPSLNKLVDATVFMSDAEEFERAAEELTHALARKEEKQDA
jgi:uncharacterized protein with von Willebrand factor type A (vWA) domain